jgi:hypothetical protein
MIDLNTYKLYCKYNGQALWEDERVAKPKDIPDNIGEDFETIATLSNNLFMIKSKLYNSKLTEEMKKEVLELQTKVTNEVYGYIERDEKTFPKEAPNLLQRIFNKLVKKTQNTASP